MKARKREGRQATVSPRFTHRGETHAAVAWRHCRFGQEVHIGRKEGGGDGISFEMFDAGHVLGSAQIAVSCKDICIVASGDYKDAPDPTCAPFEVVPCDVLIHEATFGLTAFSHGRAT